MRSVLADPLDGRLIWLIVVSLVAAVTGVAFVLAGVYAGAWVALGVAVALAVVAVVRSARTRWPWVTLVAALGLGVVVIAGWVTPIPRVAGTAEDPVPVGVPGTLMTRDGRGSSDDLNTWEITILDIYRGDAEFLAVGGYEEGVCWYVVGVVRPVEGHFPARPPLPGYLDFDDGTWTQASLPCEWDPDGPPMGEYYRELYSHRTYPDSAVLFSLDYATLDTDITPTQVEFSDTGSSQRAVFAVPRDED